MKILFVSKKYLRVDGDYESKTKTIRIQKNLKLCEKIITLIHEFGHLIIDIFGNDKLTDYIYDILWIYLCPSYKNKKWSMKWVYKQYFKK